MHILADGAQTHENSSVSVFASTDSIFGTNYPRHVDYHDTSLTRPIEIVGVMHWTRRRDLEGGKELGIWLLTDSAGAVHDELYVESHEYRGEGFDVYTATPDGEWTHIGEYESIDPAFDRVSEYLTENPHSVEGR